ncbi:MAG: NAD(P)/FAD-dependent oxidoreductase [Candidatus Merdivicinus sp.]|jgi:predicted Rossmann fold flavoprotein
MRQTLAIIGGGAGGLCAAVFAAQSAKFETIYLLERGPRVGKKLLATGNGRCNLTNRFFREENYHGQKPEFTRTAFARFGLEPTLTFFEQLGLLFHEEENGKLYPRSLQAASVLDALRLECDRLGVQTRCDTEVTAIRPKSEGFSLELNGSERLSAKYVLLAAGGAASPKLGGTDSGYRLLESLGHTILPPLPSIVQLKTDTSAIKPLSGIKFDGIASLYDGSKLLRSESGEILFTDYGLSGPPILQLSCTATHYIGRKSAQPVLSLDLFPEYSQKELSSLLYRRKFSRPDTLLENFMLGLLSKRLGQTVLKAAGIAPLSRTAETLSNAEMAALAQLLKGWRIAVTGTMGLANAQVTAGGADVREFSPETLESRLVPGLYSCGEVLDIDGDCGGFNLQWAWSSAMLAIDSME